MQVMNDKKMLLKRLKALQFAKPELVLFLDTHPQNHQAMSLLEEYRRRYRDTLAAYEAKYGKLVITVDDAEPCQSWAWINDPWPWEIEED